LLAGHQDWQWWWWWW